MLNLEFTNETDEKVPKRFFNEILKKFCKNLKPVLDKKLRTREGIVDLILVDDDAIKKMNAEYRGKNRPTDVISFAYLEVTDYEKAKGDVIVGDIFISVDTSKKQAKEKGHPLKKELEILFVHGLLHCFGFDHKTDKQEAEMEKWADTIIA